MTYKALFSLLITCAVLVILSWPQPAAACCSCERQVEKSLENNYYSKDNSTVKKIVSHAEGEFTTHKLFIVGIMWEDNILPAMMLMTEQLTATAMLQMTAIGQFFDAKIQLETQQDLQVERAKIHKYYQPSQGMCEFGSTVKSLGASERRSEVAAVLLSQRGQDRDAGNAYSSAYDGQRMDKYSRIRQFQDTYCDEGDNGNGLDLLCDAPGLNGERLNKDIDYMNTMDYPWTLDVDFTNGNLTHDEEDVLALSSYLYGHNVLSRAASSALSAGTNADGNLTAPQEQLMNARSIMAKRSVARNSYNALAASKATGSPGSREFLINILSELGVESIDDIKVMLGDDMNDPTNPRLVEPSYNAQMEVLTKKLYQNPDFYTNLYDTPTNVDRKSVALQAIGLMQKFDVFKSYLRQEAAVSVLLETAIMDMNDIIENEINPQTAGGLPAQ